MKIIVTKNEYTMMEDGSIYIDFNPSQIQKENIKKKLIPGNVYVIPNDPGITYKRNNTQVGKTLRCKFIEQNNDGSYYFDDTYYLKNDMWYQFGDKDQNRYDITLLIDDINKLTEV